MVVKEKEKCEYCGGEYVKVASHYPHCDVKKLTLEAEAMVGEDGAIDSDETIMSPGPSTELEVPASSTIGIKTDRFWAWTEGFSLQIKTLIDSIDAQTEIHKEIKANFGNSYMQRGKILEKLSEINQNMTILSTSMADTLEIAKHGKIIDEDRVEEIKKASPGFKLKPKTQDQADLEAYEESKELKEVIPTSGVVSGIVHWENDKSLPEHTRKIAGVVSGVTEKAMLIKFFNGKEGWLPKSTIKSTVDETKKEQQNFIIDSWVLKKNTIIAENE